ncbi:MAG: PadR family transcriptional regulator [Kiloniellaceae bacterium]
MDTKTLCLGVLSRADASGYEIKKVFEDGPLSHFHAASFGSIYPALNALDAAGLVACTEMAQEKRPDKKVYSITPRGRDTLARALMAPPAPDRVRSDFLFIVFLAHLLPAPRVGELIDARIAWYRDCLKQMESCDLTDRPPGATFVHGLGVTLYRAAADYLTAHRADLLDALADEDRMVAE